MVNHSELGSIFHQYNWLLAIEQTLPYKPRHILITKEGNPIGVFPNFIIKTPRLPISLLVSIEPGFGGPLYTKHEKQVIPLIFKQIPTICKGNILAHHIRNDHPGFIRYHKILSDFHYQFNLRYSRFFLSLQNKSYKDIQKNYHRRKKRHLQRMNHNKYHIKEEPVTLNNLQDFFIGYQKVMKRVKGTTLPFSFLSAIKESFPKQLKLFSARIDDRIIGRHLYLIDYNRNIFMAWLLDEQPENRKYSPSTLLNDYGIKYAIKNKFDIYDLSYAIADYTDGLFKYKQEYGTEQTPILHWEKSYSPIPLKLIKRGGNTYKKFIRTKQ